MSELAAAVQGELPAWASVFATLLLALAAAIARRISRRSARPQGERLGELERLVESERTRRRQSERELYERYGVELPYWPPDGPSQPRPHNYEPYSGPGPWPEDGVPLPHDEDQVDDVEPATTRAPSIPPLPDYPQHRR
jgi:hypothetical protein